MSLGKVRLKDISEDNTYTIKIILLRIIYNRNNIRVINSLYFN